MTPRAAAPVLLACLLLAGCASRTGSPSFVFPESTADTWDAPDGRRWQVLSCEPHPGGEYRIEFVPEIPPGETWTERLGFSISGPIMSREHWARNLALIMAEHDPGMRFRFEGDDAAFLITYQSPRSNEQSIVKVVRAPRGYHVIDYRTRLDGPGAARFPKWQAYIRGLPNEPRFWSDAAPPFAGAVRSHAFYQRTLKGVKAQTDSLRRTFTGSHQVLLGDPDETLYRTVDIVKRVPPAIPEGRRIERSIRVEVSAIVDSHGTVIEAVIAMSDDPTLDAAALAAVRQWTLSPATYRDQPVMSVIRAPIRFEPHPDR